MPWSGSAGSQTYSRTNSVHTGSTVWAQDSAASIGIRADYHDNHDQDIATGLNLCLLQNGGTSMTAALPMGGNDINAGGKISGKRFIPTVVALTDGATPALDASLGTIFTLTTTQNPTIAIPTNPVSGQHIIIAVTASGGARTLALNTGAGGFAFGADITTLSQTTSGKTDYVGCVYDLANTRWVVLAYTKGF